MLVSENLIFLCWFSQCSLVVFVFRCWRSSTHIIATTGNLRGRTDTKKVDRHAAQLGASRPLAFGETIAIRFFESYPLQWPCWSPLHCDAYFDCCRRACVPIFDEDKWKWIWLTKKLDDGDITLLKVKDSLWRQPRVNREILRTYVLQLQR